MRTAAKGGAWFALFKLITQVLSWAVTIFVARALSPHDYGLMSLSSLLTGYIEVFSELGLGAAIIQRPTISQKEYSSNFWFSLMLGVGFSAVAFGLAYPTAWIFNEDRVIPITQTISVLFLIGASMSVPFNIMMRDLRFKEMGVIQLCAVAVSSGAMLWMAYSGFGVWTLIGGTLILRTMSAIMVFAVSKWRPDFHYQWSEVRPFLRFGANVAGARSLFYMFQKSHVFVIGKVLGTDAVGYYSFAMQLASMPTDKIVAIVNQVSFPVFARLQDDLRGVQDLYLRVTRYLSMAVSPLYMAGMVWGDEIIRAVLGDKWEPIIFLFRVLCFSQLIVSITVVNGALHTAMKRAHWVVGFQLVSTILMPASIYLASQHGLNAVSIPWLTVYPLICIAWTGITLKSIDVDVLTYLKNSAVHVLASFAIIGSVRLLSLALTAAQHGSVDHRVVFAQELGVGAILYGAYLWLRERPNLLALWNLRNP